MSATIECKKGTYMPYGSTHGGAAVSVADGVGSLNGSRLYGFLRWLLCQYGMSHVIRKPVYALCEQQRRRSACADAHSDQHLCCSLPDCIIPLLSIAEISRL